MTRRSRTSVVSTVGLESLETRSLMSATALPYIELTDTPVDTVKSEVVVAAGPGSGPHASLSSVDPLEKTGLIPYVTRNPADDAGIGLLQPSDVNVDKGTVYTVTFGGTLSAPSGKFSLTFNGQTTIA